MEWDVEWEPTERTLIYHINDTAKARGLDAQNLAIKVMCNLNSRGNFLVSSENLSQDYQANILLDLKSNPPYVLISLDPLALPEKKKINPRDIKDGKIYVQANK